MSKNLLLPGKHSDQRNVIRGTRGSRQAKRRQLLTWIVRYGEYTQRHEVGGYVRVVCVQHKVDETLILSTFAHTRGSVRCTTEKYDDDDDDRNDDDRNDD